MCNHVRRKGGWGMLGGTIRWVGMLGGTIRWVGDVGRYYKVGGACWEVL